MISDSMYSARMPALTALKLRPQLLILVAATIAPVLLFSLGGGWLLVQHERATMQRDGLGRARSAMSAVNAELGGSIAALRGGAVHGSVPSRTGRAGPRQAPLAAVFMPLQFGLTLTLRKKAGASLPGTVPTA